MIMNLEEENKQEESFYQEQKIKHDISEYVTLFPQLSEEDKSKLNSFSFPFVSVKLVFSSIIQAPDFDLPFLQFLLLKESKLLKSESRFEEYEEPTLTFPSVDFTSQDIQDFDFSDMMVEMYHHLEKYNLNSSALHFHNQQIEELTKEKMEKIRQDLKIQYQGYLLKFSEEDETEKSKPILYLFSSYQPESIEAEECHILLSYLWKVTFYEILQTKHVCNLPIDEDVGKFFLSHMWAGLLTQSQEGNEKEIENEKEKEMKKNQDKREKKEIINMVGIGYFACDINAVKFHALFGQTKAVSETEFCFEDFQFAMDDYVEKYKFHRLLERPPVSLHRGKGKIFDSKESTSYAIVRCAIDLRDSQTISNFFLLSESCNEERIEEKSNMTKEKKNTNDWYQTLVNQEILSELRQFQKDENIKSIILRNKDRERYLLKSSKLSKPLSFHTIRVSVN